MSVPTDPIKLAAYRILMSKIKTGTKMPPGTGEKISKALTGRKVSKETCDRISKSKWGHIPWNKGIPMTPEQRKGLSEKAKQRGLKGERNPSWKPKVKLVCPICKNEFEVTPYLSKKRKYCSVKCYNQTKNGESNPHYGMKHTLKTKKIMSDAVKARGLLGEKHPNFKPKAKKICPICGKEFLDSPAHAESRLCCSKECKGKWQSVVQIGEGNPCWRGGISFEPYCILFNDEFKERCRIYFDYVCVECGTPQNGKKHCVHHVNYDKDTCCNNNKPLFICLCNECNLRANGNKNGKSRGWWQQHFTDMINNYYGGKCYFSKEEMKAHSGVTL